MAKKKRKEYRPILIGVHHDDINLDNTIKATKKYSKNAKIVAIEEFYGNFFRETKLNKPGFFTKIGLTVFEDKKGKKKLLMLEDRIATSYAGKLFSPSLWEPRPNLLTTEFEKFTREHGGFNKALKSSKKFKGKIFNEKGVKSFVALKILRDKSMISKIKKFKPDLIIIGLSHAEAIRKKINVKKYVKIKDSGSSKKTRKSTNILSKQMEKETEEYYKKRKTMKAKQKKILNKLKSAEKRKKFMQRLKHLRDARRK